MPDIPSSNQAPQTDAVARVCIRDGMLLGLVLVTLVRSSDVLAGEQAFFVNPAIDPTAGPLRGSAPPPALLLPDAQPSFAAPSLEERVEFSNTDFTPRKHSLFDTEPAAGYYNDSPILRATTVWQRLQQYKSRDRVRLLTLWETSGSSISLQAGRRGDPSLQWTSRLMNRGGSTQGLLDRWFSVSLSRAGSSLRSVAHMTSPPTAKPVNAALAAELK
jgi:hypothetical protein